VLDAQPRTAVWFRHPEIAESAGGPEWRADEHEVARWCRMLEAHGIATDPADLRLAPPPGEPPWPAGATVVHPGAASPARRWPLERFAAVARAEREHGREVVVTGSRGEHALALAVATAAGLPASAVVAGQTDLRGLASGIAHSGRVVCGDTGVAHLATAFGIPSIVLFGPTPPALWGPPQNGRHRVVWAGRSGDPHGPAVDPGLLAIAVDTVLDELATLPTVSAAAGARASPARA
jgi:ADP-heptose:LPS heptosyltransferase